MPCSHMLGIAANNYGAPNKAQSVKSKRKGCAVLCCAVLVFIIVVFCLAAGNLSARVRVVSVPQAKHGGISAVSNRFVNPPLFCHCIRQFAISPLRPADPPTPESAFLWRLLRGGLQ